MLRHIAVLIILLAAPLAAQAQWTEGRHYTVLEDSQARPADGKIEVLYAFWYGCPACFAFEPHVKRWFDDKPDDVEFVRLHATMSPAWQIPARAHYTAEVLGVDDKTHEAMFRAIHLERKRMNDIESIAELFDEQAGVSGEDFGNAYRGFGVERRMRAADALARRYGMRGVPTIVINGKYRTDATMAQGLEQLIDLIDFLVDKERQAMAENG